MNKKSEILIYNLPDGSSNVEVLLNEDDIWMSKDALVNLYQTSRQNIEKHIKHIYEEGELEFNRTCNKKLQVQIEGKRQVKREVPYYNLKMIIAIGYRVKSSVATSFRKWANDVIEEFMKKGFVLDDKRLEDPSKFGHDYFDELLSRIKAIRASEKRFYQKILEIYSTSIDYNQNDEETLLFCSQEETGFSYKSKYNNLFGSINPTI